MAPDEIEFHPVTAERWPDLAQLFEESRRTSSGVTPGACWCMVWRQMLVETRRHATTPTKREAYNGTSRLERTARSDHTNLPCRKRPMT